MKSIYIYSAGCTENIIDGAMIKTIAEKNDYIVSQNPKEADLIVLNTCAAKGKLEDASVRLIGKFQAIKKAEARLIVCGCLVNISRDRLESVFDGYSFSPTELTKFYEVIDLPEPDVIEEVNYIPRDISDTQMFGTRALFEKVYSLKRFTKERFKLNFLPSFNLFDYIGDENTLFVRISRGCQNRCGYCAVRFAQGKLVSHPMEKILQSIKEGVAKGHKKVLLAATNSSAYGKDIGTNILELLERVFSLEGDFKVMVSNYEPFGIVEDPEKFLKVFSSRKLLSFFCPINGGSQNLLRRMRRNYDIKQVMAVLGRLQTLNPAVVIRTEFIIGYPGERWRDYFEAIRLILTFKFNQVELHCYSPRPNTEAITLDKQVSGIVKYLRLMGIYCVVFVKVILPKLRPF